MRAATILLALLLIPLTTAVNTVDFTDMNGNPINYINPGEVVTGKIHFTLPTQVDHISIAADTELRTTNNQAQYDWNNPFCNDCTTQYVYLRAAEEVTLTFTITNKDNTITTETHTISFSVDNEEPLIHNIDLNGCSNSCALSNNPVPLTFEVTDTRSGLDANTITAALHAPLPLDCEALVGKIRCNTTVSTNTGGTLNINAEDLAGNTATKTIEIRADNNPPAWVPGEEPHVVGRTNNLPGGQPITIAATVLESERATITLETPWETTDGQCVREQQAQDNLVCTVTTILPNTAGTQTVNITVQDIAGNKRRTSLPLDIKVGDTDTEPNFWNYEATQVNMIDPYTWVVHEKIAVVRLHLTGSSGASPVEINVKGCSLAGLSSQDINAEDIVVKPQNGNQYVQLTLRLRAAGQKASYGNSEVFSSDIECEVDTYSRIGTTVFTTAETDTITFTPRFASNIPPPQEMKDIRAKEAKRAVQRNQDLLRKMQLTAQLASTICGLPPVMTSASTGLVGLANAFEFVPGAQGAARGAAHAGEGMHRSVGRLYDRVGWICNGMSCDSLEDSFCKGLFNAPVIGASNDNFITKWTSAVGGSQVPEQMIDPYKSWPLAICTQCWPAIMYHQQARLNVQCQYSQCIQTMDATGLTAKECEANRDYQACALNTGSLALAVPLANVWDSMLTRVNEMVSNPLGLAIGGLGTTICKVWPDGWGKWGCEVVEFGDDMQDFLVGWDAVQRYVDQASAMYNTGETYCADVEQEVERVIESRSPFAWENYCNAGFCSYQFNNKDYVVTKDVDGQIKTYIVVDPRSPDPTPGEKALRETLWYGGELREVDCGTVPGNFCEESKQALKRYQETVGADLSQLDSGEEYMTAAREYENALNNYNTAKARLSTEQAKIAERLTQTNPFDNNPFLNEQDVNGLLNQLSSPSFASCDDCGERAMNYAVNIEVQSQHVIDMLTTGNNLCEICVLDGQAMTQERALQLVERARDVQAFTNEVTKAGGIVAQQESIEILRDAEEETWDTLMNETENLKRDLITEELKGFDAVTVRRYAQSILGWSRIGKFVTSFGLDDRAVWGDDWAALKNTVGRATEEVSVEERLTRWMCENKGDVPHYERAFSSVAGGIAAQISASRSRVGEEWQYRVDVYISVPESVDQTAKIYLEDPGRTPIEDAEYSLLSTTVKTGMQALTPTSTTKYRRACIVFEEPLGNYFPDVIGANNADRALCTKIQERER